jgi:hypothetical protein
VRPHTAPQRNDGGGTVRTGTPAAKRRPGREPRAPAGNRGLNTR